MGTLILLILTWPSPAASPPRAMTAAAPEPTPAVRPPPSALRLPPDLRRAAAARPGLELTPDGPEPEKHDEPAPAPERTAYLVSARLGHARLARGSLRQERGTPLLWNACRLDGRELLRVDAGQALDFAAHPSPYSP